MNNSKRQDNAKVALITGSAKRIGAAITRKLYSSGYKVIIPCNESTTEAAKLAEHLNRLKPDSAQVIQQALSYTSELENLLKIATGLSSGWMWSLITLLHFYPLHCRV